jgi:DNA-binding FadR family transcriptional regulator
VPTRKPGRRKPAPVERLHEALSNRIGEKILDGTYAPGALLPNEAEWSRMFGASRTAIREAIKTLSGKGLLVSRPKVGSRVEPRERWNLLDRDVLAWHCNAMNRKALLSSIQEIRRVLEPGVAALAAAKRDQRQLKRIGAALKGMADAETAEEMIAPDLDFHLAIIDAAQNDLLVPFGLIIEQALRQMFDYTSRHNPKPLRVIPLHSAIHEAIAARKPDAARQAVMALLADTDQIIAGTGQRRKAG